MLNYFDRGMKFLAVELLDSTGYREGCVIPAQIHGDGRGQREGERDRTRTPGPVHWPQRLSRLGVMIALATGDFQDGKRA